MIYSCGPGLSFNDAIDSFILIVMFLFLISSILFFPSIVKLTFDKLVLKESYAPGPGF